MQIGGQMEAVLAAVSAVTAINFLLLLVLLNKHLK